MKMKKEIKYIAPEMESVIMESLALCQMSVTGYEAVTETYDSDSD